MDKIKVSLQTTIAALAILIPAKAVAQTNLNFNAIGATSEGAIVLSWNSTPNEIYEIDEADALNTNYDGTTLWNMLYSDYPSQGTNTFWLDTGNYFAAPEIVHPSQSPMRFYRITLTGTNTTPTVPQVAIASPTDGASTNGSLTVTVNASTDQSFLSTKLYVDGQEMNEPDTTTNYTVSGTNYVTDTYVLNTCEWPNGTHTLFATASCQSGASGTHNVPAVLIGYGVSPFVPVTFNNLITRISFSQPFFAPEDGTTQQVAAVFAANVDWTLQIQDVNSNTVRTVTGSGGTLSFGWDGTDDGGTNLPVGTYTYLLSASTNGQALISPGGGGGSGGGVSPPSPSFAAASSADSSISSILWAAPSDGSGNAVPLAIYPPGYDTNTLTIFEASAISGASSRSSLARTASIPAFSADGATPDYSGSSSQSSRAPVRPPIAAVRGRAGVFGIAFQTYRGVASGYVLQGPDNGLGFGERVDLEGYPGDYDFTFPVLWGHFSEARNFVTQMKKGNWTPGFNRLDDALGINDLRASGANIFNQVQLGLLLLHGTYGTTIDYDANEAKQMYFPITSGASAQYIRMSEMDFGSPGANGLKWMAISACNSLQHNDWHSMQDAGVQPYNSNLHLLLGTDAIIWTGPHVTSYWAKYMTLGKVLGAPMTVQAAWYAGAQDAYAESGFNYTNAMYFAAAGDAACQNDFLQTNSAPTGSTFYSSVQVWPTP